MLKISSDEIKLLSKYIYEISGIYLDESKKYLLETRLNSIVQEQGCANYLDFQKKAKADASKAIERKIIDAISTNETLFFRDTGPFQLLQHKILPELIDARTPKAPGLKTSLKIWSAASSTGVEGVAGMAAGRESENRGRLSHGAPEPPPGDGSSSLNNKFTHQAAPAPILRPDQAVMPPS